MSNREDLNEMERNSAISPHLYGIGAAESDLVDAIVEELHRMKGGANRGNVTEADIRAAADRVRNKKK